MHTHPMKTEVRVPLRGKEAVSKLPLYPVDMSSLLDLRQFRLDDAGVPCQLSPAGYHPGIIAHYALVRWNQYLATDDESHRNIFLAQAHWLIEHEVRIGNEAGGWPVSSPHPDVRGTGAWLSALVQGNILSVLIRAYQLTQNEVFIQTAQRATLTFARDILDGGVSGPVGEEGIFFEEVAVYPASHVLSSFIFAVLGLYDYVTLIDDAQVKALIQSSLATMHVLLEEFDTGFWTRADLLHRKLASPEHLILQAKLVEVLAAYSGCEHCSMLSVRWKNYQCWLNSRLRYVIADRLASFSNGFLRRTRSKLFPQTQSSPVLRVCVPITAFPFTGGMRTVLAKIEEVTADMWQMEYLTQHVGQNRVGFVIRRFGKARATPWQFPVVWLYCLSGLQKLVSLMRQDIHYDIILPQDGIFTAAFAALVGRLAGVRVVCIDHGNLVTLKSRTYRTERIRALATKPLPRRIIERLLLAGYWPSLDLLTWLAAHFVDHFCIPGVAGDGVEEICRRFGVGPGRLTRFVNTVDINRHVVLDAASRAELREKNGIPPDAIVITTICRLSPEKGLDIALESIRYALTVLPSHLRSRTRFIIVGEGPLRKQIENHITRLELNQTCVLWGEASHEEVLLLHSLSDIYLYTGVRGGGYSLVMLEAMASGCAVLASAEPLANERMLANGRGMVVPVGDIQRTGMDLVQLVSDAELRCQMGRLARTYVAQHNTADKFKRVWVRATYWAGLDTLLSAEEEGKQ